jgi:uncharacterized membrane protein
MSSHQENEIKKEFQLERIIFFSDAVFAIIITILVLDVRLPEVLKYTSEAAANTAFFKILPKLLGYIIAFYIIGGLWMKHLRMFSFLKDYNQQLVVLNLLFLLSVSLYPFGQSLFFSSGDFMQYHLGGYIYVLIVYFSVFTQTLLIGYLIMNKAELCIKSDKLEMALRWRSMKINYWAVPVMFILLVCTVEFKLSSRVFWIAVFIKFIVSRVLDFIYYRHYKEDKVTLLSLFSRISKSR